MRSLLRNFDLIFLKTLSMLENYDLNHLLDNWIWGLMACSINYPSYPHSARQRHLCNTRWQWKISQESQKRWMKTNFNREKQEVPNQILKNLLHSWAVEIVSMYNIHWTLTTFLYSEPRLRTGALPDILERPCLRPGTIHLEGNQELDLRETPWHY